MKTFPLPFTLIMLMCLFFPGIALPSPAAESRLIAFEEIGELVIEQDGILITDLNIVIGRALQLHHLQGWRGAL